MPVQSIETDIHQQQQVQPPAKCHRTSTLIKIDDKSTTGMDANHATQMIRGQEGTKVKLIILYWRGSTNERDPREVLLQISDRHSPTTIFITR
jgi:hypothetical protein